MTDIGKEVRHSWQRGDQRVDLHFFVGTCTADVVVALMPMHEFGDGRAFHWCGSDEPETRAAMQSASRRDDIETLAYPEGRSSVIDLIADPPAPAHRGTARATDSALAAAIDRVTRRMAERSRDLLADAIDALRGERLTVGQALGRVDLFHPFVIVDGVLQTIDGRSLASCRLERRNIADGSRAWIDLVQRTGAETFKASLVQQYQQFYQHRGCRKSAA